MNTIGLTQDQIFEFSCDNSITEIYLESIKNSKNLVFRDTGNPNSTASSGTSGFGYPLPRNDKLFSWFQECVDEVSLYKFGKSHQFICDAWLTKTTFGQSSSKHVHYHSIFSGLFYLNDSTTPTEFFPTDYFFETYNRVNIVPCKKNDQILRYLPKKGTLLIFPSYLHHKIALSKDKTIRYTLSFNTFFNKTVSSNKTEILKLNVCQNFFEKQD